MTWSAPDAEGLREAGDQRGGTGLGITVQGNGGEQGRKPLPERSGNRQRILVGIQFDRAGGILHRIGLLGEDLLLDQRPDIHSLFLPSLFQPSLPYFFVISSPLSSSSSGVRSPFPEPDAQHLFESLPQSTAEVFLVDRRPRLLPDGGHRVPQADLHLLFPIPVGQHDGAGPEGIERHEQRPVLQEDAVGPHLRGPADFPPADEELVAGGRGKAGGTERPVRRLPSVRLHLRPDADFGQALSRYSR